MPYNNYWYYSDLKYFNYKHGSLNHSTNVYANGDIHVNSLEGFWSLLKRGISGVCHSVSINPKTYLLQVSNQIHNHHLLNSHCNSLSQVLHEWHPLYVLD